MPPPANIDPRPPAIFLMGPTASGKTALACALADRFQVGIISVDSALVYRGLDIGAAKPDRATLARYPHALVDIRDAEQPYSAALFREDALREMQRIGAAGKVPLLVGGTGLYFRALQRGLSEMPAADPALRARMHEEAARDGWPALHARLALRDPEAARRIRPHDAQRIQRALESIELTGLSLGALHARTGDGGRFPWRLLKIALLPRDRGLLRERIAARFDAMLAAGFIEEVQRLRARGDLSPDLPAMRAVGYRQAWPFLAGDCDRATFRQRAIDATRQLAKRQATWLRGELDARTFDPDALDCRQRVIAAIKMFLPSKSA